MCFALLALSLCSESPAHARQSVRSICLRNLQQIDSAKEQLSLEKKPNSTNIVSESDLADYIKGRFPKCPSGGVYKIGAIGELSTCSIQNHSEAASENFRFEAPTVVLVIVVIALLWVAVGWTVNRWQDSHGAFVPNDKFVL
jgi:hypothetical protein